MIRKKFLKYLENILNIKNILNFYFYNIRENFDISKINVNEKLKTPTHPHTQLCARFLCAFSYFFYILSL